LRSFRTPPASSGTRVPGPATVPAQSGGKRSAAMLAAELVSRGPSLRGRTAVTATPAVHQAAQFQAGQGGAQFTGGQARGALQGVLAQAVLAQLGQYSGFADSEASQAGGPTGGCRVAQGKAELGTDFLEDVVHGLHQFGALTDEMMAAAAARVVDGARQGDY